MGWFLFIVTPFLFGGFHRTRYMIVAYPLLAVLLAKVLSAYAEEERFQLWAGRLVSWVAALFAMAGLALACTGAVVQFQLGLAGIVFLLTGVVVWRVLRQRIAWAYWPAVAAIPLVAFWATELWLRPVFSSSPAAARTRMATST